NSLRPFVALRIGFNRIFPGQIILLEGKKKSVFISRADAAGGGRTKDICNRKTTITNTLRAFLAPTLFIAAPPGTRVVQRDPTLVQLDNVLIKNTRFLIICKYRPLVVRLRLAARPLGSCSPHCGASANFTGKKW